MGDPAPRPRVRLQREERERHFLKEAISFFAEVGFGGDTKALASRLGVVQPLLYRYFPSKDALIERVFEETFLSNWNPLWEEMLTDRAADVTTRLLTFHNDFARVHLNRDRVRLSLFFALRGWDMTAYFRLMRDRVYVPIAADLREYAGEPGIAEQPLREVEVELAKSVVEKIQYYGIRKWVYDIPSLPPIEPLIAISVRGLLDGARAALPAFRGQGETYSFGSRSVFSLMRPPSGAVPAQAPDEQDGTHPAGRPQLEGPPRRARSGKSSRSGQRT